MQLQKDVSAIRKAGFELAAISYDDAAVLRDFSARKKVTFPLLSDRKSEVIRRFGVADRAYQKNDQLDLEQEKVYNGDAGFIPVYGLSYPAVFVVDAKGSVVWRFVSEGAEFRLSGSAILEKSLGIVSEMSPKSMPAGLVKAITSASNGSVSLGSRIRIGASLEIPARSYVQAARDGAKGITWDMAESRNCWTSGDAEYPPGATYEGSVRMRREVVIRPVIKASDPSIYKKFRATCLASNQILVKATLKFTVCGDRGCTSQSIPLQWSFEFVPPDLQRVPESIRRENQ